MVRVIETVHTAKKERGNSETRTNLSDESEKDEKRIERRWKARRMMPPKQSESNTRTKQRTNKEGDETENGNRSEEGRWEEDAVHQRNEQLFAVRKARGAHVMSGLNSVAATSLIAKGHR